MNASASPSPSGDSLAQSFQQTFQVRHALPQFSNLGLYTQANNRRGRLPKGSL